MRKDSQHFPAILLINSKTIIQGVPEKPHKILHTTNSEPQPYNRVVCTKMLCSKVLSTNQHTNTLFCKLFKHSLLSSQKCSHLIRDVTCMAPLTVEDAGLLREWLLSFQLHNNIIGPTIWDALQHMIISSKDQGHLIQVVKV